MQKTNTRNRLKSFKEKSFEKIMKVERAARVSLLIFGSMLMGAFFWAIALFIKRDKKSNFDLEVENAELRAESEIQKESLPDLVVIHNAEINESSLDYVDRLRDELTKSIIGSSPKPLSYRESQEIARRAKFKIPTRP